MRPTIPVPGRLSAAFLSSAIAVLLFAVMVSCQGGILRPMLALLPMPALGGVICLGCLIWCIVWLLLYCILSGRESVSTLPVWTGIFLGSTLLSLLIAEMGFAWSSLVH